MTFKFPKTPIDYTKKRVYSIDWDHTKCATVLTGGGFRIRCYTRLAPPEPEVIAEQPPVETASEPLASAIADTEQEQEVPSTDAVSVAVSAQEQEPTTMAPKDDAESQKDTSAQYLMGPEVESDLLSVNDSEASTQEQEAQALSTEGMGEQSASKPITITKSDKKPEKTVRIAPSSAARTVESQKSSYACRHLKEFEEFCLARNLPRDASEKLIYDLFFENNQLKSELTHPEQADAKWAEEVVLSFLHNIAFMYSQHMYAQVIDNDRSKQEDTAWLQDFLFEKMHGYFQQNQWFSLMRTIPFETAFDPSQHQVVKAESIAGEYRDRILGIHQLGVLNMKGEIHSIAEVVVGR